MALARIVNFPGSDLRDMKYRISDKEKTIFEELFRFKFDDIERLISEYMGVAIEYTPNEVELYLNNKLRSKGMELSEPEVLFSEGIYIIRRYEKKDKMNKALFELEYNEWFIDTNTENEELMDKYIPDHLIKATDIEKLILNTRETALNIITIRTDNWRVRCDFPNVKSGKIKADFDYWSPSFWTSKYLSDNLKVEIKEQSDGLPDTGVDKQYSSYQKIIDDLLKLIIQ